MSKVLRPASVAFVGLALAVPLMSFVAPTAASAATALPDLVINEVDASGVPQDWIELKNAGQVPVDASGMILKDDKDEDRFDIPAGTVIPAGGYASFDVADFFGLGKGGDSARLYLSDNTTLVDSFEWASDSSPGSWGRCPDGTGAFATMTQTKGTANICAPSTTPPTDPTTDPVTVPDALAWPGSPDVTPANVQDYFGTNLSGLSYELGANGNPDTVWAVQNGAGGNPDRVDGSAMYRLQKSGGNWVPATDDGWGNGKALHYADGTGIPDAEGVVRTATATFVATERDNSANTVSRPAVLRYDTTTSGTSLNASMEWNLVDDLPVVGPNLGLEGITFVPDSYLTSKNFIDEKTGTAYDPATYANHGDGLYFVGLEGTGSIYAYALDQTDATRFTRVATIGTVFPAIMEVQYDAEKGSLWAACDNTCGGQYALLDVAQAGANAGHFAVTTVYNRPAGMGNFNNEGFVTAPQALCQNGVKPVFWADDDQEGGYSLREGSITCTAAAVAPEPTATPAPSPTASAIAPAPAPTSNGHASAAGTLANTGPAPLLPAAAALFVLLAGGLAVTVNRRHKRA